MQMQRIITGTVQKWLPHKGYGFVKGDDGTEAFVYVDAIVGGSRLLEGGQVTFQMSNEAPRSKKAKENGKMAAISVSGPGVVPRTNGSLYGKVTDWNLAKGYGFIEGADGSKAYCHQTAFDGARLEPGEAVWYDTEDVGHTSGRPVAVNVSGPAVKPQGGTRCVVKSWFPKGFGFVEDQNGTQIFVHQSIIGGGWLNIGKEVYCDIQAKVHGSEEKLQAINVTGPAIMSATDVNNNQQFGQQQQPQQQQQWGKRGARMAGGGGKGMNTFQKADMPEEVRQDTDGNWYTKTQFILQYGGTQEWDARPSQQQVQQQIQQLQQLQQLQMQQQLNFQMGFPQMQARFSPYGATVGAGIQQIKGGKVGGKKGGKKGKKGGKGGFGF